MDKEPLISIIIPVYNTSKYVRRCLDSVVIQTYKNIEIIVIDDGSTDDSFKILTNYSRCFPNIRLIAQKNRGQSVARNRGINLANGEYIMFVDSDDYVDKNFCQVAYNSIKSFHTDIAIFGMYMINGSHKEEIPFNLKEGVISKEMAMSTAIHSSFPVNKIYKYSLFKNIKYPINYSYEDMFTTYKLIDKAKGVSYIDTPLYYYNQRYDSTVHHHTGQSATSYFIANQQLFSFLKRNYPMLTSQMISSVLKGSIYFLAYTGNGGDKHLKEQADQNLKKLCLPKSLSIKWFLIFWLYRHCPKLALNIFKLKQVKWKF